MLFIINKHCLTQICNIQTKSVNLLTHSLKTEALCYNFTCMHLMCIIFVFQLKTEITKHICLNLRFTVTKIHNTNYKNEGRNLGAKPITINLINKSSTGSRRDNHCWRTTTHRDDRTDYRQEYSRTGDCGSDQGVRYISPTTANRVSDPSNCCRTSPEP